MGTREKVRQSKQLDRWSAYVIEHLAHIRDDVPVPFTTSDQIDIVAFFMHAEVDTMVRGLKARLVARDQHYADLLKPPPFRETRVAYVPPPPD